MWGGGTGVCVRLIGEGGTRCVRLKGKESRGPGAGFHLEKNVWGGSSGKCRAKCFEAN